MKDSTRVDGNGRIVDAVTGRPLFTRRTIRQHKQVDAVLQSMSFNGLARLTLLVYALRYGMSPADTPGLSTAIDAYHAAGGSNLSGLTLEDVREELERRIDAEPDPDVQAWMRKHPALTRAGGI